jgi:hypothetical protein
VQIVSPANGALTNHTPIDVSWTINGVIQPLQRSQELVEGPNTITRSFTDATGKTGSATITVTLDSHPPVVVITSPANGLVTNQASRTVAWTVDGVPQTTDLTATLVQGSNTITRTATDAAGNTGTASITVTLDTQAPVVMITSPSNGLLTNQASQMVAWTVDGVAQTSQLSATLSEGTNTITRSATDAAGNVGTATITATLDTQGPVVTITSPVNGMITNQVSQTVAWTVDGVQQITQLTAALVEGVNTITRSTTDAAGNTGTSSITITLDTQAPVVSITSPLNGLLTNQAMQQIAWAVDGITQTTQRTANLVEGANTITRTATDAAGNIGTASITVMLDTQAPIVVITSPANGLLTNQSSTNVTWTVDGVPQTTQLTQTLVEGTNSITRTATDLAGNTGTSSITVTRDTQAPVVVITSPAEGFVTTQSPIAVAWTVDGIV